jgi:hypothetical protein
MIEVIDQHGNKQIIQDKLTEDDFVRLLHQAKQAYQKELTRRQRGELIIERLTYQLKQKEARIRQLEASESKPVRRFIFGKKKK